MADFITTVSRKYSQEIQTAEYGFGLEGVLRARGSTDRRNSQCRRLRLVESRDRSSTLRRNIRRDDLSGKAKCKADLLKEFGLAQDTQLPVVGIVSRFAAQKGFDLIQQVADRLALRRLDPGRARHRRSRIRRHVPPAEQTVSAEVRGEDRLR